MSLDQVPPHDLNPNTGGKSDRGKKKRTREAERERKLRTFCRNTVKWPSPPCMSGTGCDRRERRQEVLSGADLVGRGEDHEDDLGNGAGTRNQASHSASMPPES